MPRVRASRSKKSAKRTAPTRPRQRDPSSAFAALAGAALKRGDLDAISDAELRKVLAAAVKLYAAKVERHGEINPVADGAVTATETVVAVCGMIRAADLNLFDVAMWFHRPTGA